MEILRNVILSILEWLVAQKCRRSCHSPTTTKFSRQARIANPIGKDAIRVGDGCLCMGQLLVIPNKSAGGQILIGDWCYLGPDSKIWAMDQIKIGNRVFISHGVSIFDNNSHSFSAAERHARFKELRTLGEYQEIENIVHRPVVIEDDVWIGFSSAILKGVTVGRGAIIGACSVVTHDVEPYSIVVGNPARRVGTSQP